MNALRSVPRALPEGGAADRVAAEILPAGTDAAATKVLLLATEIEDYTISFANGVARHVPVVLAVPRRRYGHLLRWFDPAVDVRLLDWPRHRSIANLRLLAQLTALIRRERPSVIHLLSNTTVWLNLAAPFWRSTPLVTTVHDVAVHPGDRETAVLPTWATRLIVRQSDDVVVHGEGLRRRAADHFSKRSDRVHVLSHPSILRYAELAEGEGLVRRSHGTAFNVLLFGRIFAYKGLERLIRAEALLADRIANLRIVIAGRGDDPWALRGLMGDPLRYDIRNRYIEDREVAQLFLDSDVVVLPYAEASQSGVLNLAAAFGKPLIVTDVGELRDTVEPHRLGLVVGAEDTAGLALAMAAMAEHPALREGFGANARLWARGPNAPETVGGAAAALYRAIGHRRTAEMMPQVRHHCPGGRERGGGIGRLVGHVVDSAGAAGAVHRITDTRGARWSLPMSAFMLAGAILALAWDRLAAPVASSTSTSPGAAARRASSSSPPSRARSGRATSSTSTTTTTPATSSDAPRRCRPGSGRCSPTPHGWSCSATATGRRCATCSAWPTTA